MAPFTKSSFSGFSKYLPSEFRKRLDFKVIPPDDPDFYDNPLKSFFRGVVGSDTFVITENVNSPTMVSRRVREVTITGTYTQEAGRTRITIETDCAAQVLWVLVPIPMVFFFFIINSLVQGKMENISAEDVILLIFMMIVASSFAALPFYHTFVRLPKELVRLRSEFGQGLGIIWDARAPSQKN